MMPLLRPLALAAAAATLLNVSYDPTRELYQDVNAAFTKAWAAKTGQRITINQSPDRASVTMSASSPSITDRACLPEPPCDWLIVILWPVFAAQAFVKAAFTS